MKKGLNLESLKAGLFLMLIIPFFRSSSVNAVVVQDLEVTPTADVIILADEKITPVITADSMNNYDYDGLPHYIIATIDHGLQDQLVIVYRNDVGETITEPVLPGTYVVDISFAGNDAYNPASLSVGLTIKEADFKDVSLQGMTVDYDGQPHNLTVIGAPEGTTVTYDKKDLVDAGNYLITVHLSKPYYKEMILTNYLTINQVTPVISAENLTVTYDGLVHKISSSISHGLTISKTTYRNSVGMQLNEPTNADTYSVTITYYGSMNYKSISQNATLIINPAPMTGITLPDDTVTYDGTLHNLSAQGVPEDATVTYDTLGYVNAGTYKIGVTVKKQNYLDFFTTGELTINQASLAGIVTFSDKTYVYSGHFYRIEVDGLPLTGASVVYYKNSQINAGTYNAMAVIEGYNFQPLTLYARLTILKAEAVITAEDSQQYVYDEFPKTVIARLNHNEAALSYDPGNQLTEIGTYNVTITAPETANYFGATKTVTVIIRSPEILGVTFEDVTLTYDGIVHTILAGNIPEKAVISYQNNSGQNAGTYEASVTVTLYMEELTLHATLTINKAEAVITADDVQETVYDGTFQEVEGSLNHSEASLTYSDIGFTTAGDYSITISARETLNYLAASKTVSFIIHKATPIINASTYQDHVYDGTYKGVVATLNHNETILVYAPMNGYVNAGTYHITVSSPETENYLAGELEVVLQIDKAPTIITAELVQTDTYDGRLKRVHAMLNHFDTPLSFLPVKGYVNAGSYPITIVAPETANYLPASLEVTLIINKATMRGATFDSLDVVYDGLPHGLSVQNAPAGVLIQYTNHQATDAGIYPATAVLTLDNYEDLTLQATLTIRQAVTVIDAETIQQFDYDGFAHSVSAALNFAGATLTFEPAASFTNIGGYDVNISIGATGNYTAAAVTVHVEIIKGTPVITAPAQTVIFNGQSQFLQAGISHGLSYEISYLNASGDPVLEPFDAGIYSVLLVYGGSDNYNAVIKTSVLTILPAPMAGVTFVDEEFVYDGLEHCLAVANAPEDAVIDYHNNQQRSAGIYEVTATLSKLNHQTLTLAAHIIINPKPITLENVIAESRDYNGRLEVNLVGGNLVGVLEGDDVSFNLGTGLLTDPYVATGKTVKTSVLLKGKDKVNYVLKPTAITTDITPLKVTLSTGPLVKVEDGSGIITIEYIHLNGTVYLDDVYLAGTPSGTFQSINPGSNIPVAISGLSLEGEDAFNYEIDASGIFGTILKKTITVQDNAYGTIVVSSEEGFDPQLTVRIIASRDINTVNNMSRLIMSQNANLTVRGVYEVTFVKNGQDVRINQPFVMKVSIPKDYRTLSKLYVYDVTPQGDMKMNDTREGNDISFDAESLTCFVFVSAPQNLTNYLVLALSSIMLFMTVIIIIVFRYQHLLKYKYTKKSL